MQTALIQAAIAFFFLAVMFFVSKVFMYFRKESYRASELDFRCRTLLADFQNQKDHAHSSR